MVILPTYVELVWGCSNASFGILRPGFRFLPMGKDIRIKLRSKLQHESGDRDCSKRKGLAWERVSSHLPIQRAPLPTKRACGWCPHRQNTASQMLCGRRWSFPPLTAENILMRMLTLFTQEDLTFPPCWAVVILSSSFFLIHDGNGRWCQIQIFFLFNDSHPCLSILQLSNLICKYLIESTMEVEKQYVPTLLACPFLNHLPYKLKHLKDGESNIYLHLPCSKKE